MIDTKQKILDAAERLFSEQGCCATSLRQIVAEAGVNLAAIHYHYGSKDELLRQVVQRKAGPANEERLKALERLELEPSGPPALEQVLEAFLAPTINCGSANPAFSKLLARLVTEGLMAPLAPIYFGEVRERYLAALGRALPGLAPVELRWRFQFMIGTVAHALSGNLDDASLPQADDVLPRVVAFASGGFAAPLAVLHHLIAAADYASVPLNR